MEKYKSKIKEAEEEIEMADHLIYVTSPVVKDKNLFLSAFDHIYQSFKKAIYGFLLYKKRNKQVSSIPDNSKLRTRIFLEEFGRELGINKKEWQEFLKLDRSGRRKEEGKFTLLKEGSLHFILDDYNTTSLGIDEIKDNLLMIKELIKNIKKKCQGEVLG